MENLIKTALHTLELTVVIAAGFAIVYLAGRLGLDINEAGQGVITILLGALAKFTREREVLGKDWVNG